MGLKISVREGVLFWVESLISAALKNGIRFSSKINELVTFPQSRIGPRVIALRLGFANALKIPTGTQRAMKRPLVL